MKPYGKKKKMMKGKCEGHNSDTCHVCSNRGWKISKKRERHSVKMPQWFIDEIDDMYNKWEWRRD